MNDIVILGAGTGGTLMANLLRREAALAGWRITIIDGASEHIYQPGLLFLPFRLYGYEDRDDLARPITDTLPEGVYFVNAPITALEPENRRVVTRKGSYDYDWLICSLGCHIAPDRIDGLPDALGKNAWTFYSLKHALALQEALSLFRGGRLVIDIAEMPIKCPVAPIEFAFLADYYFEMRGLRDAVEITLVTPYPGAFTKPIANRVLSTLAADKDIHIVGDFALERVDGDARRIHAYGGAHLDYDMLVVIPPNLGPDVIRDAGLGTDTGYALTDPRTLKSTRADNIYILGDNSNVHTSKSGSVAHFEAETVVHNLLREIDGKPPEASFDGHANCFIESGHDKALLIDFNYDVEPVEGHFPLPFFGPFSLLRESHVNHMGKLAFRWVYWHLLLPGHLSGQPFLPAHLSTLGKDPGELAPVRRAHQRIVADIMTRDVITITQGSPLGEAARLMHKHHISGLPVLDAEGRLAGIVTEADFLAAVDISAGNELRKYVDAVLRKGRARRRLGSIVDDLMTPKPVTVSPDASLEEAARLMDRHGVKRLVVVDDDQSVAGILARADLLQLFTA